MRPDAKHPLIIEELLNLAEEGKQEAVDTIIQMLEDLHIFGLGSRYIRALKNLPLFELKTTSRGKTKGGCRVYLFLSFEGDAYIVNCEVKEGDQANQQKLKTALTAYRTYIEDISGRQGG
jgi:hypothetical protein